MTSIMPLLHNGHSYRPQCLDESCNQAFLNFVVAVVLVGGGGGGGGGGGSLITQEYRMPHL